MVGTATNAITAGNAAAAAKADAFSSNKSVTLTGDVTGTAASTGGWSVATTLANSGITAGTYGQSSTTAPGHGGTFTIPYITFDAKGRATSASNKTITLPSAGTDTKNTAGSTNSTSKLYLVGATSQAANPQTYSHSAVYATGGAFAASSLKVFEAVTLSYNTATQALDFVFA